jgi:uncharacterized membrane protein (UPF0127 family)
MFIYNKTRSSYISKNAKVVTSLSDQLLGLINPNNPRTLIFHTRWGIHTYFLTSAIAVVILDKQNKVVQKTIVKPWRMFFWNPRHGTIVELPIRAIGQIKVGDLIELETSQDE